MRLGEDRVKFVDPTQKSEDGSPTPVQLRPEATAKFDPNAALREGRYEAIPDELYDIKDNDGKTFTVKGTDLLTNLQNGYRLETFDESVARRGAAEQAQAAAEGKPLEGKANVSAAQAFGAGAVDTFSAGLLTQDEASQRALQSAEELHPGATMAGRAVGVGGQILGAEATGLAGLAARFGQGAKTAVQGGSLLSRAAAPVVGGAVEGAVLSAPIAGAELAQEDPEAAAEALLFGLGVGGVFGGIGAGFSKAGDLFESGGKKLQALGKGTPEANVGAGSLAHRELGEEALTSAAKKVDDIGGLKDLDDFVASKGLAKQPNETYAQLAQRIERQNLQDTQALDDMFARVGAQERQVVIDGSKSTLMPTVESLEKKLLRSTSDPKARRALQEVVPELADAAVTGRVDPQKLWQVKQALAAEVKETPQLLNARKLLEKELSNAVDKMGDDAVDRYLTLTKDFRMSDRALKVARQSVDAEAAAASKPLSQVAKETLKSMDIDAGDAIGFALNPIGTSVNMARKALWTTIKNNPDAAMRAGNKVGAAVVDVMNSDAAKRLSNTVAAFGQASKKASAMAPGAVMREFNGGGSSNPQQAFATLNQELGRHATDPTYVDRKLEPQLRDIRNGQPDAAAAYQALVKRGYDYLSQVVPRSSRVNEPFRPVEWTPSGAQFREFARRLEVIRNPDIVVNRFRDGTLKREHVEALNAVYPKRAANIKQALLAESQRSNKRMPAVKRALLDTLLNEPGSPRQAQKARDFAAYQQALGATPEQPQPTGNGQPIRLEGIPGAAGPKGSGLTPAQKSEFGTT